MAIVQHEPEELEPSLEGKPSLDKSWDKLTVKTAIGIGLFVISVFIIAIIFDDGSSAAGPNEREIADMGFSVGAADVATLSVPELRAKARTVEAQLKQYGVDLWPKDLDTGDAVAYENDYIISLRYQFVAISRRLRELTPDEDFDPNARSAVPPADGLPARTHGAFAPLDAASDDIKRIGIGGTGASSTAESPLNSASANDAPVAADRSGVVDWDQPTAVSPAVSPRPADADGDAVPAGPYLSVSDDWGVQSIVFGSAGLHVIERSAVKWEDGCMYPRDWYAVEVNHDASAFRAVVGKRCSSRTTLGGEEHSPWVPISSADIARVNSSLGGWLAAHTTLLPPVRWALVELTSGGATKPRSVAIEAGISRYESSAFYLRTAQCEYHRDYHAVELKEAQVRAVVADRCSSDRATAGETYGEWATAGGQSHAVADATLRTDVLVKSIHWDGIR